MEGSKARRQPRRTTFPARWAVAHYAAFPYTTIGGGALRRHDTAMPTEIDTILSANRLQAALNPALPTIALSVVVPVHNERENIAPLVDEIVATLSGVVSFEIVYVDDGSTDGTSEMLRKIQMRVPMLRVLTHDRSAGQSTAIRTGVLAAHGRWIATLDGDGQNDPADIPGLLTRACSLAVQRGDERVLIAGWRTHRKDSGFTRWQSRIANGVRSRLLGDGTPDTGCGLKVYARSTFIALPYFDHMHRFMPALVRRDDGDVVSVPVNHRPRTRGASHYGVWNRLWTGLVDMAGVVWLARRARVPQVAERLGTPRDWPT